MKKAFWGLLCALVCSLSSLAATPESGKVYRIKNQQYNTEFITERSNNGVGTNADADSPELQYWLMESVEGSTDLRFKNLSSGNYLWAPETTGTSWAMNGDASNAGTHMHIVEFEQSTGIYRFLRSDKLSSNHWCRVTDPNKDNSAHTLRSWNQSAADAKWTFELVDLDQEEIDAYLAAIAERNRGKVYRIKNVGKGTYLADRGPTATPGCAALNTADDMQLWFVEPVPTSTNLFTFRSLGTGYYLFSSSARSASWSMSSNTSDAHAQFIISDVGNNKAFRYKDAATNAQAHIDPSNNLVCWGTDAINSQWLFELVDLTPADIEAKLDFVTGMVGATEQAATLQAHLDALFSDKACTQLKGSLSGADYDALPQVLKDMAQKVSSGNWAETTGNWDSAHAKKYRVQHYEPFSEGGAAASKLCKIQAYTNMNNPTGIVGNRGDLIYVMVEDEVPVGATLYINGFSDVGMHNGVTEGYELHQGLNIIPCFDNLSHYFVYYTVNTVDNDGRPVHSLKEYEPIKIHIEGGRLNGFFNSIGDDLYDADTRADYDYTSVRAVHPMFDLISKYNIFHIHKEDTPNKKEDNGDASKNCHGMLSSLSPATEDPNRIYDPVAILKYYDELCLTEFATMGIKNEDINSPYFGDYLKGYYELLDDDDVADPGFDYGEYFNNRVMSITMQDAAGLANATSWRIALTLGSLESVLVEINQGGIWVIAHEFGHINQQPMKIAGTTEESNNIFSNVALYYHPNGSTSRADYISSQLEKFNNGATFLDHGTWGTTRMFYQLWLYYHAVGHNRKFYPRLYQLLRVDPLVKNNKNHLNAKDDLLHFAKMCCVAAQEDLTEFFTVWGFFTPLDDYFISDYDEYHAYLTQEDIDEVKAEIAAMNLPKASDALILIDDRPNSGDRAGNTQFPKEGAGEFGGLNAYNDDLKPKGDMTFSLDGTALTVAIDEDDDPGVGIIIRDENGNIIAFGNTRTLQLSPSAAQTIIDGNAVVSAIGADGSALEVEDVLASGSAEDLHAKIQSIIDEIDSLLEFKDVDDSHPGLFTSAYCAGLEDLRQQAESYAEVDDAEVLLNAIRELQTNVLDIRNRPEYTPIVEHATYLVSNYGYREEGKILNAAVDATTASVANTPDAAALNQKWVFESTGTDGHYFVRNAQSDRYLGGAEANEVHLPLSDTTCDFTLIPQSTPGVWAFAFDTADGQKAMHMGGGNSFRIVRWSVTEVHSHWMLTKIDEPEFYDNKMELKALAQLCEEELGNVATVIVPDYNSMALTADSFYSNAPHMDGTTTNADHFNSYNVLIDGDNQTWFHSSYEDNVESADGLNHYIRVKAPEGEEFGDFKFTYVPRPSAVAGRITAYTMQSTTDEVITEDTKWSTLAQATGLESNNDTRTLEFSAPRGTRYIRFIVDNSGVNADANKPHKCFAISEISIQNRSSLQCELTPEAAEAYPSLTNQDAADVAVELRNTNALLHILEYTTESLAEQMEALAAAYENMFRIESPNKYALLKLIEMTQNLLDETCTIELVKDAVPLAPEHLDSNAKHGGTNATDQFTENTWSNLLSGAAGTHFHSSYDNHDTSDGLDHYILVTLPEGVASERYTAVSLSYRTRTDGSVTTAPKEYVIEISPDGETWEEVLNVSDGLPSGGNETHTSELFSLKPDTKYVRFMVKKTYRDAEVCGHQYFVVSKFGMSSEILNVEPVTDYVSVPYSVMADAHLAKTDSENLVAASSATEDDFQNAYANLENKYNDLVAARLVAEKANGSTSIEEIGPDMRPRCIYDLQGRKVANPTRPGIYIINGQKQLVR